VSSTQSELEMSLRMRLMQTRPYPFPLPFVRRRVKIANQCMTACLVDNDEFVRHMNLFIVHY
jgi:hypothetical protein